MLAKAWPVLLSAVALAGCSAIPTRGAATATCPAPAPVVLPVRPELTIKFLPADASCPVMRQAYIASLNQCMGYTAELLELIPPPAR